MLEQCCSLVRLDWLGVYVFDEMDFECLVGPKILNSSTIITKFFYDHQSFGDRQSSFSCILKMQGFLTMQGNDMRKCVLASLSGKRK